MSRYETFVIRLWMEDDVGLDHGEVRHVGSGAGRRFRQMYEALDFVQAMAARESDNSTQGNSDEEWLRSHEETGG
jgi:hypothetical protein